MPIQNRLKKVVVFRHRFGRFKNLADFPILLLLNIFDQVFFGLPLVIPCCMSRHVSLGMNFIAYPAFDDYFGTLLDMIHHLSVLYLLLAMFTRDFDFRDYFSGDSGCRKADLIISAAWTVTKLLVGVSNALLTEDLSTT